MQWAAVRTQQDERRIPPHKWLNSESEPLVLACTDTCQGWAPGAAFLPPVNLREARGFPHWENGAESGTAETGGVSVAEKTLEKRKHSVGLWYVYFVCVCVWEREDVCFCSCHRLKGVVTMGVAYYTKVNNFQMNLQPRTKFSGRLVMSQLTAD